MAAAPVGTLVETKHEDTINDVQFDYSGKRIATASSDNTIKIYEAEGAPPAALADLRGHTGPVWRVAWAHPKFGSLLASCSYDRRVIIWKESQQNTWDSIYEYSGHQKSVTSVCWAPVEYGLELACSSTDGHITVLTYERESWKATKFLAHSPGVTAVSWAPALHPGSLVSEHSPTSFPQKRLVSGGCDNLVIVWRFNEKDKVWEKLSVMDKHKDWVRDVSWADSAGPVSMFASCSQDGLVVIWTQNGGSWNVTELEKFSEPVWHVSWSITGNILAVSSGANKVSLWKDVGEQEWKRIDEFFDSNPGQQAH